MKLNPSGLDQRLRRGEAGSLAGALAHGGDRVFVRETASAIARAIVPDLADPFLVTLLEGDDVRRDPARLSDELDQLALMGGRRLVWLREAQDRHAELLAQALTTPSGGPDHGRAFLLIEAGELAYRSPLRQWADEQQALWSIACSVADEARFLALARDVLSADGLSITPDAVQLLRSRTNGDYGLARQALEVLALYVLGYNQNTEIQYEDVLTLIPDQSEGGFEEVVDALLAGKRPALLAALERALAGGASAVGLLRGALRAFQRLDLLCRLKEAGQSLDQAFGRMRPPLPFAARRPFADALARWDRVRLARALSEIDAAEARAKTAALPDETIVRELFVRLAR